MSFTGMVDDKAMLQSLGLHIREVRKSKGLTQEQLAELCEFDSTYISLLERGERNPPFLTLCNIADKLGVTISRLVA